MNACMSLSFQCPFIAQNMSVLFAKLNDSPETEILMETEGDPALSPVQRPMSI